MAQTLIKVDYPGINCNGLYFIDDNFGGKLITKQEADDQFKSNRQTFKFVLRQTVTIKGIGKVSKKETYIKEGVTFQKAVESIVGQRQAMKQRIIDGATGVTQAREEEQAIQFKTVNEIWDDYYHHKTKTKVELKNQKRWAGATAGVMRSNYKKLIKDKIGNMRIGNVKMRHIKAVMDEAKDRGLKDRSAYSIKTILKGMFRWYFDEYEIDKRNPADIELGKLNNERDVELSWEQVQTLYNEMYSYKNKKYRQVFMWLSTGRRLGETLSLDTNNIDGDYYTIIASKNKAGVDMIYRVPSCTTHPTSGYVHTAIIKPNHHLSAESVNRHWENIRLTTGLTSFRKHDLRHIITTKLKEAGVPLEIRAMVIGHKGTTITDRYTKDTKANADLKHKAVTLFLNKVFNKIKKDMMWDEYIRNT